MRSTLKVVQVLVEDLIEAIRHIPLCFVSILFVHGGSHSIDCRLSVPDLINGCNAQNTRLWKKQKLYKLHKSCRDDLRINQIWAYPAHHQSSAEINPLNAPKLHGEVVLTNDEYHSGPGVSKSKLDAIAVSGLNYWDQYVNPDREPQEFKHCFAVGDGTHKLVLEPGTFELDYAVDFDKSAFPDALDTVDDMKRILMAESLMTGGSKPELARRLVEEAGYPRDQIMLYLKEAHEAGMKGKICIPAKDYKGMLGMLKAVNRHPWAGGLLSGATVERSFFLETEEDYIDHDTGKVVKVPLLRKCRVDALTHDGQFVVDLKTTDDVSVAGFGRTIVQRRYEVQAAWYLDILRGLYGKDAPRSFAFVATQKTRPHDVAVHWLTDDQIERGRRLYKQDVKRLIHCQQNNLWLGCDEGALLQAELPYWAMREEDFAN